MGDHFNVYVLLADVCDQPMTGEMVPILSWVKLAGGEWTSSSEWNHEVSGTEVTFKFETAQFLAGLQLKQLGIDNIVVTVSEVEDFADGTSEVLYEIKSKQYKYPC